MSGGGQIDQPVNGAANETQTLANPLQKPLESAPTRTIRSFVRRNGRISAAQERSLRELLPQVSVTYQNQRLDLDALFGRRNDKILEIGFGMGETTARMAAAAPDLDFLALDVHEPGVGALCKRIAEQDLHNVRLLVHDAVEVLRDMIGEGTLSGVHIFFPDPWHKKRHHKRRLIQAPLVALLSSRLKVGGYVHCATDWQDYAEQMLAVLRAEPRLKNRHDNYAPRPSWRPQTKFETRGLRLGHGVWDLIFERCL